MPNDVINTITINNNTYDIGGTGCGKAINMTLSANSWDANNRQSLQFSGYRSGQSGVIGMPTSVTSAQKSAYQNADISIYSQSSDTFTFECGGTVPSIDLPVSLFITDLGGGSGGSGGHTIEDADGTDMTQRTNLQFLDAGVTDDSTDDVTKIENVQVIDDEDDLEDAPDGIYMGDWDDADAVIDASIVGYDNTDSGLEATDVQGAVDELASNKVDAVQGKGLSTNDYDNTDKAKVDKINETTQSATGNPISISGLKSNQLAVNPIITLEPIQAGSGTPSPSNVRAISGYDKIDVLSCGVNVWDEETRNGYYLADGSFVSSTSELCTKNKIPIIPSRTYYLRIPNSTSSASAIYVCEYDKIGAFIRRVSAGSISGGGNGVQYTSSLDAYFIQIDFNTAYGGTYNHNISVNYPATDTDYHAYVNATSISESLGQTVYGLTHEVRTGKATVTLKAVDMGDLDYYRVSDNVFTVTISDKKSSSNRMYCSCFDYEVNKGYALDSDCISDSNASGYATTVFIKTTASYSSSALFKTAVTGQKLVYPLATPITIQLTPHEISLLKDYAYVSTNGTNISLSYHNGEIASLADVSQLGETVNEGLDYLKSYVEKNKYGSWTDLSPYNSANNAYVFPSDGYVQVSSESVSNDTVRVVITSSDGVPMASIYMVITGQYQIQSVFVRKGMKAYIIRDVSGTIKRFYSLE